MLAIAMFYDERQWNIVVQFGRAVTDSLIVAYTKWPLIRIYSTFNTISYHVQPLNKVAPSLIRLDF